MNRPYTASSPYSLTPTERIRYRKGGGTRDFEGSPDPFGDDHDTDVYPRYGDGGDDRGYGYDPYGHDEYDYPDDYDDDYDDDEIIDEASIDRRWMWIGGVAGAVLFIAVIATSMILSGGDSGSVSATVASPLPSSSAPTPSQAPAPRGDIAPTRTLPPETITTLTPSVETAPPPQPTPAPPPQAAPPPAAPPAAPGTITYRITGNRDLIDLVTVIYTDQRGALQTELNVALPWTKTVVLDPGVTLMSVTATSVRGQLNCSISDANGNLIAAQNSNSIFTNCTR
ncbi:MAG: hypothetical protein SW019_15180 [Actinomycetota bacterium]|nr:hypothetical protein [Actinomycetota bacterium]